MYCTEIPTNISFTLTIIILWGASSLSLCFAFIISLSFSLRLPFAAIDVAHVSRARLPAFDYYSIFSLLLAVAAITFIQYALFACHVKLNYIFLLSFSSFCRFHAHLPTRKFPMNWKKKKKKKNWATIFQNRLYGRDVVSASHWSTSSTTLPLSFSSSLQPLTFLFNIQSAYMRRKSEQIESKWIHFGFNNNGVIVRFMAERKECSRSSGSTPATMHFM